MPLHTFTSPNGEEYEVNGPEGSTREQAFNILQEGIKAGYYKPKSKKAARAEIPGQGPQPERQPDPSFLDKVKGVGEAALQLGTGMVSGVQAPIAGLVKSALGMVPDAEKEAARLMEEQTYAPRSETGQDYGQAVGEFMNRYVIPGAMHMPSIPKGQRQLANLKAAEKQKAPLPVMNREAIIAKPTIAEPSFVDRSNPGKVAIDKIVTDLGAEPVQPRTPFTSMVDALQGKEGPIEPAFKMAPEEAPYVKGKQEAALDDATAARLQAAVDRQNVPQDPMRVTPEGQAYTHDAGVAAALEQPFVHPDSVGLSTGEGMPSVADPRIAPYKAPEAPVAPRMDPTLGLGETAASVADPSRPRAIPPEQPVPPRIDPALGLGEGSPSVRDPARTMVQPTPTNDPFGSLAGNNRIGKFRQGGSAPMLNDIAEGIVRAGKGFAGMFIGEKPPVNDTILTPRSEATIAAKQEKGAKATAIGLTDSVYTSPSTIEEVVARPGKDISGITQEAGAGVYAAIRRNSNNAMLKYTNRLFTDARLNKIKDSVEYITGKNGYNDLLKKLSVEEKMQIHQDSIFLDKHQKEFTPELAQELGYTPAMTAFMEARMRANNAVATRADGVLSAQGMKLLNRRISYAAANFDGAYRTLVGKWVGEGAKRRFQVDTVINATSKWEHDKGVAWAKENMPGSELFPLERRGLTTEPVKKFKGMEQDATARLLSELAEIDPRFKEAKAAVDEYIQGQTKKLYRHDLHELHKKGVTGAIGDRPWLDARRNAEDFFAQEVNHIEEGFQYWNYQKAINETRQMTVEPKLAGMKNTVAYLDKYLQSATGQGLNPVGAGINWMVDKAFASTGYGSAQAPKRALNNLREAATIWMMGIVNPMFSAIQLTQIATGMFPEALRIRSEAGISPTTIASSFANSTATLGFIAAAEALGKSTDAFPKHLVEAYAWAKEHGITQYNEVEQSHAATQNPKWHATKQALSLPITVPEKITTPQAFMWATDMLYNAGLRGDDLHRAAYNASKYAMTEYHPDEAPMVYQRLGVAGPQVGGLKKFVHNAVDQQVSRTMELAKHPAAFSAMLGMTMLTMGAMGLAGVGVLDKMSLSLTDKSLRDHWDDMFGTGKGSQGMRDGFASTLSGFDLQSRYSMADLVPGSFGEAVAGPHISKLFKMGTSLYDYGTNPDKMNFTQMAKQWVPSGMLGTLEQSVSDQPIDKEGMRKFPKEMDRTPKEQTIRKLGGPRPIRERLYDSDVYNADVMQKKVDKDRLSAISHMRAAINLKGGQEDFKRAFQDYMDAEGDPSQLEAIIQRNAEQLGLDTRQRRTGIAPKSTITSIKKWERYNQ